MNKDYKPRKGSRLTKEQAELYGNHIDVLMEGRGGEITPQEILEDATKISSPLHDHFECSDTEAADKYRLDQARYLMINIVTVTIVAEKQTEQRSFWNVKNEVSGKKVYVKLKTATTNENYRNQLIDKITNHLNNTITLLKMFKQYG